MCGVRVLYVYAYVCVYVCVVYVCVCGTRVLCVYAYVCVYVCVVCVCVFARERLHACYVLPVMNIAMIDVCGGYTLPLS
jgi:hypothetical protein